MQTNIQLQKYLKIKLRSIVNPLKSAIMVFELDDSDIAKRYAENLQIALHDRAIPCHVSWGMYANKRFFTRIQKSINKSIDFFNKKNPLKKQITQYVETDTTHEQLNFIHSKFEEYANLYLDVNLKKSEVKLKESFKKKITYNLNNINNCVHTLESIIDIDESIGHVNGWFTFSLKNKEGDTFEQNLKEEDFDLFTLEEKFGWLYLGYATTGKNLHHIMKDNNVDILKEGGKASPQITFSTNLLGLFGSYAKRHEDEMRIFNTWWDENNISQYGYKKDDKKNSIGYIKIGEFVPTGQLKNKTKKEIVDYYTEFSDIKKITFTTK
jgi:hypothetical protein